MAFVGSGGVRTAGVRSGRKAKQTSCGVVAMYSPGAQVQTERKCTVKVEQKNGGLKQIPVELGANLRTALRDNGVDVYTLGGKLRNCGGNGACGLCVVDVVDGAFNLTPMTPKEEFMMNSRPVTHRLACRASITGDCTVRTKPSN